MAATARRPHRSRGDSVTGGAGPVARARASLRALETLDRLTTSGTAPSDDDLAALRGWAGWGPMAPAFAPGRSGAWQEIGERLEWLLPPDQLREAQQATPNAFYTPPDLAAACWQILRGLGFDGGRVLEPGCGAGVFISAAPADVGPPGWAWNATRSQPGSRGCCTRQAEIINERLQNAALPAHSVDAVIGNVPFGETPVYDPTAPDEVTKSLHNYCIWRSVRTLRPGRRGSPDHVPVHDGRPRRAGAPVIAEEADLVGAIRLPNDALAAGGTEVVTDILVLRRRGGGARRCQRWTGSARPALRGRPGHSRGTTTTGSTSGSGAIPAWCWARLRPDHAAQYGRTLQVVRPGTAAPLASRTRRRGPQL